MRPCRRLSPKNEARVILLLFCVWSIIAASCTHREEIDKTGFIQIENDHFTLEGKEFFPIMLNYVVQFQNDEAGNFIFCPFIDYDSLNYYEAVGKAEIAEQIRGHFRLIKDLGFNTLRICIDRIASNSQGQFFYQTAKNKRFYLDNPEHIDAILQGLNELVEIAHSEGLKVMLLIKSPATHLSVEHFTVKMLQYFKDNPTIFAYDFMNEPLYFDADARRTKEEVCTLVNHWKNLMTLNAPRQLFTVGLAEPIEVFTWDPSMLPVDFIEFHTYHPLRVPSEIYWYSTYSKKPWIVGETSLPADKDSITYQEYIQFLADAYQLVRDAGGSGFGWWEFQDVQGMNFEHSFTGLLNHEGETFTNDGKYKIFGTLKIPRNMIDSLEAHYIPKKKTRPVNYFNMLGYSNICITGTILDAHTRQPVEGAVIRGWNLYWSVGVNTYSDENGKFTLFCNDPCCHFKISAPGRSTWINDRQLQYTPTVKTEDDVHQLPDREREYHQISYHGFIQQNDTTHHSIFNFDPTLFNRYNWTANMGVILLDQKQNINH
ncbi:MAG: cellulase family glycosylhydrolase [Bacteroidales bacterium]|nr:cellulase family glycosylhydrolase [Bacteroidales bacterium]